MGEETLPDASTVASGLLIKSTDFLTTNAALKGALVGRNSAGVPTSGKPLGTTLYSWGNVITDAVTISGSVVDVSQITSPANRIISGKTRTTSGQPQFLQADGAAATVKILGAATDLLLSINSAEVTVSTDISETGLTTAPATNNTCAINDTSFTGQAESKYFGEIDSVKPIITLDAVGSEISARVGQFVALKTGTSEIMWGWLKSATELTNVKRGYFFDNSLSPVARETLANNDILTLMETGWMFVENDGLTVDVTYLTPVYAYTAPGSPSTGQYWYDISNVTWKRWSGSAFVDVARKDVGLCVMDTSNCIASRSFDFYQNFKDENTIDVGVFSDTIVRSADVDNSVSVYGSTIEFSQWPVEWDNTANMDTGTVAASTTYYLYLSEDGEPFISLERPYDRTGDLRGKYHPYNNWRYIASADTDGTSDWLSVLNTDQQLNLPKINEPVELTATSTELNKLDGATVTTAELNQLSGVIVGGSSAGDIADIDSEQELANKTLSSELTLSPNAWPSFKLTGGLGDASNFRPVTKLTFSTVNFDTNNDVSSSVFTPSVAGKYLLMFHDAEGSSSLNTPLAIYLYFNATKLHTPIQLILPGTSPRIPLSFTTIVSANGTTDSFTLFYEFAGTGVGAVAQLTSGGVFCGSRIA